MNNEMTGITNSISNLRGLLISNRLLAVLCAVSQIYLIVIGYKIFSPLYILVTDLLLPMILEGFMNNGSENKQNEELPLPLLRKKYNFSFKRGKALSYGFLLNVVLLIAWHYNFAKYEVSLMRSLPSAVLFAYVATRVVIWIVYLLIFKFFPSKLMK
ncbi:MAG: hypothetical protein K6F63_09780 [Lachnospiraceae bacterium]|nr:hypothetical protein [Lachnospiraceae bacterium]